MQTPIDHERREQCERHSRNHSRERLAVAGLADGTNPHAEVAPPIPLPDWRTRPVEFLRACVSGRLRKDSWSENYKASPEQLQEASDAIGDALEDINYMDDGEAVLELLSSVGSALGRHARRGPAFLGYGPIYVPMNPNGREALGQLVNLAAGSCSGMPETPAGSAFRALGDTFQDLTRSGIGERIRNTTSNGGQHESCFTFSITLSPVRNSLPKAVDGAATMPPKILESSLIGFEVDDCREMQSDCDMCMGGTVDFLNHFGVEFDHDEDTGCMTHIAKFTLTGAMVEFIEQQGFGPSVRSYADKPEGSKDLGDVFATMSDDAIRERLAIQTHGATGEPTSIKMDPKFWSFSPDLARLKGADTIGGAAGLRAGALLTSIAAEYVTAGLLPPIPGKLTQLAIPYGQRGGAISAAWCPDDKTLTLPIGERASLVFSVSDHTKRPKLLVARPVDRTRASDGTFESAPERERGPGADPFEFPLYEIENERDNLLRRQFVVPGYDGGVKLERMLALYKGRAEV